jgi:hypothetical protein
VVVAVTIAVFQGRGENGADNLPRRLFAILHRTECWVRTSVGRITHPGHEHSYPFCGKQFGKFFPYVNRNNISVTTDVISSLSISTDKYPYCHSHDRERGGRFRFGINDRERIYIAAKPA